MNLDELFGGSSVPGLKIGRHELKLDRARIMAVLEDGAQRARVVAQKTLAEVRRVTGLR